MPTRKPRTTPRRPARRRALLVANPAAQSGRNEERIAEARSLLDAAAIDHDFLATLAEPGKTAAAVRKALRAKPCRMVIAMGGDGTIADVARGLVTARMGRKVPLGLLPTGTANDIGKSFGLSSHESQLSRNVDVLAVGNETDFDAGLLCALDAQGREIAQELFFDSAGWGFAPRALRMRNEERRMVAGIPIVREFYRDHLLYAATALKTFGESYLEDTKFDVEVVADGVRKRWEGLNDLVVKGPRIYAGMWVLDPEARHDDGLFEVIPFAGRRDWLSKALMCLDHTGSLADDLQEFGLEHAQGLKGARIELTFHMRDAGKPLPAQVDGEEFVASRAVRIDVLHKAIRLVIP